jgi:hypothetical protein
LAKTESMTYISIDTNKKEALLFLEYVKTLPFVTIYQKPNRITRAAMSEVKKGKTRKHKNSRDLISALNK